MGGPVRVSRAMTKTQKWGPRITDPEPLKRLRLKDMGDLSFWKSGRPPDVKSLESWETRSLTRR